MVAILNLAMLEEQNNNNPSWVNTYNEQRKPFQSRATIPCHRHRHFDAHGIFDSNSLDTFGR